MLKRAQIQKWAQTLSADEMRPLLIELVEWGVDSEMVRMGDLAPYWEMTGDPLVDGQKCWSDME